MRGRIRGLAWLLAALCLLLTGCQKDRPAPDEAPSSPALAPTPVMEPDEPPEEGPQVVSLDRLSVEVVVDWEDADRILSSLEELSRLLGDALGERDCFVDEAAVTIGTAGGITAQALGDGGVDAAFLPLEDLAEMEDGKAVQVLESAERGLALAVTGLRADQRFCGILPEALTATEAGVAFLEICYPGTTFTPVE